MSAPAAERTVRMVISGRVQGVSFRYFTRQVARRLGLVGWVRNLPSGQVEVRVRGTEPDLELLRQELRQGPPAARVDDLSEAELAAGDDWYDFQITY